MKETNHLFPVFLKLEQLRLLIVGGGAVGLEKLNAVLSNSPGTPVRLVATSISDKLKEFAAKHRNVELIERPYQADDLENVDVVIVAVNDRTVSQKIHSDAKANGKLINVADTPDLCDFYLSSVVKKGNLKIAISTNGKSPTIAKRLKEIFTETLPDQVDDILEDMVAIRNKLNGDFAAKIKKLNEITKVLSSKGDSGDKEKK